MNTASTKRKDIIKNIAIIFLIIMLALTFFSNTIMNMSLPEVSAQYASSGTITTKVRGSGTVTANANYEVKINETRKISAVFFKTGDTVAKGDVLFELADVESDELIKAEKELEALEYDYKALVVNVDPKYSTLLLSITDIKNKIAKLEASKTGAGTKASEIAKLKEQIKALTGEIKKLDDGIKKLNAQLKDAVDSEITDVSLRERIEAARSAYEAAKLSVSDAELTLANAEKSDETSKNTVDNLTYIKANADDALAAYEKNNTSNVTSDTILKLQRDIEMAELELKRTVENYNISSAELQNEYNSKYALYNDATVKWSTLVNNNAPKAEIDEAYAAMKAAETVYLKAAKDLSDNKLMYDRKIEDQNIALSIKRDDLMKAQQGLGDAQLKMLKDAAKTAETNLNAAKKESAAAAKRLESSKANIESAKKNLTERKNNYDLLLKLDSNESVKAQISELETEKDTKQTTSEELTEKLKNLQENNSDADKIQSDINEQKQSLMSKQLELYKSNTDIEKKQKEIDDKESEIEKLRKNSIGAKITADVGGTLSSVKAVAGEKVESGTTLAEIFMADKGYTVSFSVTKEQAARIKEGDAAKAQYFWNGECNAIVASIKNDPANPSQNRIVSLNVSGDVTAGQSITFTLGERGANYDTIVPNSAVREDNNGKFILVVTSKSTPLGNRYTATRVDVQVLASDETQSALSSSLYGNEFIITASTKPIEAGVQVRLNEEQK